MIVQFDEYGYRCVVLEGPLGNLNGYVLIRDPNHPLFGKGWDELEDLEVHGGVTYAASDLKTHDKQSLGDDKPCWWIGFDTAHYGDFVPEIAFTGHVQPGAKKRSLEYVIRECRKLARQISVKKCQHTNG